MRIVVAGEAAQGELVEIGGIPALVTALLRDGVEVAPFAPVSARFDRRGAIALDPVATAITSRGPLVVPAGDDLIGRSIDALGNALDRGPSVARDVTTPVWSRDPAIYEARGRRLTLGTLVYDLQHWFGLGSALLAHGRREVLAHILRHQVANGLVVVIARPAATRPEHVALVRGDLPCVIVTTPAEGSAVARWLVPWTALAIAAALRGRGRDVVVAIDDLDAWKPHALKFPERGGWSTQLLQLASRGYALGTGSVSLLARTDQLSIDRVAAFDEVIDLARVLRGDLPDRRTKLVRPPIRVPRMGNLGFATVAAARLAELEELGGMLPELDDAAHAHLQVGKSVRECLRFRLGATTDSVEQVIALYAVVTVRDVPRVIEFVDSYLAALRRDRAGTLAAIRKSGRISDTQERALLELAEQIAARFRAV